MRIDLVTPFAEKDAVKALGARWDAAKKVYTSPMRQTFCRSSGGFLIWSPLRKLQLETIRHQRTKGMFR
jgi:hypothetical protein